MPRLLSLTAGTCGTQRITGATKPRRLILLIASSCPTWKSTVTRRVTLVSRHSAFLMSPRLTNQKLLEKLRDDNIKYVFVPASCTSEFQSNHLVLNSIFKTLLWDLFMQWYAGQVRVAMHRSDSLEFTRADLRSSVAKPIHSGWLIQA